MNFEIFKFNLVLSDLKSNAFDLKTVEWTSNIGTRIPTERFSGPTLITVGESDEVWSPDQTRHIEATLKKSGDTPEVHYFPGAKRVFKGKDEHCRKALVTDFLRKIEADQPTGPRSQPAKPTAGAM